MKRFIFLTLLLFGCSAPLPSTPKTAPVQDTSPTLMVFAAASLTDAFAELGADFESTHPGAQVTFNFAGSHALQTQIEAGAPADIFASASTAEMDALVAGGFIPFGASQIFLTNRLIVILPPNNPAALRTLAELANPGIKVVLAAQEVPAGKYARQALEQMNSDLGSDFKDRVLANVVSNEDNVRQILAKVQLGEADAGIVYNSDAAAAPELKTIEIPAEFNVIAQYPIAPLTQSSLAADFVAYVLSPEGQSTLQKWGFEPVK